MGAAFCDDDGCCFRGAGGGGGGRGGAESSHVSMRERTEVRVSCGRSSEDASSSRLSGSTEANEIPRCGTGDRERFIVVCKDKKEGGGWGGKGGREGSMLEKIGVNRARMRIKYEGVGLIDVTR